MLEDKNSLASGIEYDHVFYIRVFEGCNLYCSHCFIPSNPKRMTLGNITECVEQIHSVAMPGSKILIQWHGGEPTVLGASWFKQAIDKFNSLKAEYDISHGIQTNLITYDDDWKDIYLKYFEGSIGVSWDPGIRHMRNGKRMSNKDYEIVFWEKMELLIRDGIAPYLIVTGTKVFFEKYKNPLRFIQFIDSKGIKRAHIERLTKTGYARDNWPTLGVNNAEYSRYMSTFYRTYSLYDYAFPMAKDKVHLSPFDGLENSVQRYLDGKSGGYGCLSGVCDSSFHTFDQNGYKGGCTALNSESDNSNAGGVAVLKFFDINEQRLIRTVDCAKCEYKKICSSGCLATEIDDGSGECSGGKRLFRAIESNIIPLRN